MSLRTAKFMKALTEKARTSMRVADMISYETALSTFEVREKQTLDDLFAVIQRRANEGHGSLNSQEEPVLKRHDIKAYLLKKGFTFEDQYGRDAVFWDKPYDELK